MVLNERKDVIQRSSLSILSEQVIDLRNLAVGTTRLGIGPVRSGLNIYSI